MMSSYTLDITQYIPHWGCSWLGPPGEECLRCGPPGSNPSPWSALGQSDDKEGRASNHSGRRHTSEKCTCTYVLYYILDKYWQDYNTDLIACILIADQEISCSTCFDVMHYLPRIHSGTSVPLLCQCQGFSQLPRRQQVCMYVCTYVWNNFYTGTQVRVKDLLRYSAVDGPW